MGDAFSDGFPDGLENSSQESEYRKDKEEMQPQRKQVESREGHVAKGYRYRVKGDLDTESAKGADE